MTDADFHNALQHLTAIHPGNLLLNKFRREGNTAVNALLLQSQLAKALEEQPTRQSDELYEEEEPDPVDDDTLRGLRVKLRKLFGERSALSDRFYGLKTVQDRADNSEDIQLVQRNIERTMQSIRHYRIHGSLPEEAMRHYVPKDGLELSKKQNSLRANISREKRIVAELRQAHADRPGDRATERKLEKRLSRLEELKTDLKNVTEAIEDLQQ